MMQQLLDHRGRPMMSHTAHHGASYTASDMVKWMPGIGSADADILPDLETLIARQRDLERNNPVASATPQTLVDNIIGPVLKLSSTPDWKALGKDKEWAREWSSNVERRWKSYSTNLFFDSEHQVDFSDMAGLAVRGRYSNGGAMVIPKWLPSRPGANWGTCFQSVEIDRLSNPNDRPDTDRMRGGIEYDENGAPLRYWIRNSHPGDCYGFSTRNRYEWTPVVATTEWGRRVALHCFHKTRSGQSRAVPALTSMLSEFKSMARLRQATLQTAVANALVAFFFETQMDPDSIASMFADSDQFLDSRKTHGQQIRGLLRGANMDENMIVPVHPGDRVTSPLSTRPGSEYGPFMENIMRHIGAGVGLSYETTLRDFSRTNYSSARAALLLDWKTFMGWRKWLVTYFAQPVYCLWLEEAVNRNIVEAPDFYENLDAYTMTKWTGAGRGFIDPTKETQASRDRLNSGTSTLENEHAEQGRDYQEQMEQRLVEIQEAADLINGSSLPEKYRDAAFYVLAGLEMPKGAARSAVVTPDDEPEGVAA
ncbi:MAG: phage portal protein [Woeseia sp.]|nr:phage portal protein [Woeseia sp.]